MRRSRSRSGGAPSTSPRFRSPRARTRGARRTRWCATSTPGADPSRVTVSSDGGGCLPVFDGEGRVASFDVGSPSACGETLRGVARPRPVARAGAAGVYRESGPGAAAASEGASAAGGGCRSGGAGRGGGGGGGDGAGAVVRAGRAGGGARACSSRADSWPAHHHAPLPDPPPRCILGGAEDLKAGGGRRRPYSWREGAGGGWPWIHHPGGWSGREDRRRHDPQAVRFPVRRRPDRDHPYRLRAERHRRPLRSAVPRARRRPGPLPPHP